MRLQRPLQAIRDHLVGGEARFVLEPRRSVALPPVPRADIYLHIPFCHSLCPYCPYNRILYEESTANAYVGAVLAEIDAFADALGPVEIGSVRSSNGSASVLSLKARSPSSVFRATSTTPRSRRCAGSGSTCSVSESRVLTIAISS